MRIIPMEHRDIITSSPETEELEYEGDIWMLSLLMCLMLGFSSCNDKDLPVPPERDLVPASFFVEMESDTETRLSVGDKDTQIIWHEGDMIKLYDGCETPHVLEYKSTGKFEGQRCPDSYYSNYRAVYPVSKTSSYNDVSIGATQEAVAGSFDKKSVPMIAYAKGPDKLSFKIAFSLLKIKVPEGYSKIVVSNYSSSENASYLTGAATLEYDSEVVSIDKKSSGSQSVTLVPSSGSEIAEGTYYLSVFPCAFTGLQLACYKGDEIFFRCEAKDFTIARKKLFSLGDLTDSKWSFTCKASKITPSGSAVYYLADRNLGAAKISDYGNSYTKSEFSSSTPSSVWGPGWNMPYKSDLQYWADILQLSTSNPSIAVTPGTGNPEVYFLLGNYWGSDLYNSSYLHLSLTKDVGTGSLIKEVSESQISSAAIRPVFVP